MSKQSSTSRRNFITNSVKGGLALGIGINSTGSFLQSCTTAKIIGSNAYSTGFDQQPLPYKYDALENVKGVQMITSSLTFKVPNTRGFNIPNNFRFMQLVDVENGAAYHDLLGFLRGITRSNSNLSEGKD